MISNKEKNFISMVIYVNNNEKIIFTYLKNLYEALNKNFDSYEIICVNDASSDNSANEIKKFADTVSDVIVNVITMSYFQGLEISMNSGIDLSIGDFVFEIDSANSFFDENRLMSLYKKSSEGYDIVIGKENTPTKWASKFFYKLFNKYSNSQYKLDTDNYRLLSRRAINRVQSMSKTIPYRKAVYATCGLKLIVMAFNDCQKNTKAIVSKHQNSIKLDLATSSLILYTNIAYQFTICMAILMIGVIVFMAVYAVSIFLGGNPIEGWTTTILFLSIIFFGLFTILAIIIKYLSILVDLNFKKQKHVIESITKYGK